jgi:serralysin
LAKAKNGDAAIIDASEIRTPSGLLTPLHDAAVFNASFQWETSSGLPTYIQDLVGTEVNGKIVLPEGTNTPGTVSWQLDSGLAQDVSDGIITYGFFDGQHAVGLNNNPSFGEGQGYTPFTEAQKAAARDAIQNWDDLIAPTFVEINQGPGVSTWAQNTTDILLANTTTGPAQAWTYYPGYNHQYQRVSGDVWVADPRYNTSNSQFLPGQYGLQTLDHELGHALGLSHPGNYNFGDDNDGDGIPDPITYGGDAFYFQDSNQFTIMSYFDSYETGAQNIDYNFMRFLYPSTPMVDDVYVIQQKYGADLTTRTGDTTYGFNSTADVTNEAMKFHTGEMATIFTIWDANGNDTLD